MPPEQLSVIVNTGDDIEMFGLYIAPDLDIVSYTLAGLVNPVLGWGINSDTFYCLDMLLRYTEQRRWFNLGDRDLATHIFRTYRLKEGARLSEITDQIRMTLGVESKILPMTDTHTPTTILTKDGEMHFQEYLVKHLAQPVVTGIRFENIETAEPAPGVANAILETDAVVICPSNPLISIGPILAVPGMRELVKQTPAKVVVVSSVVDGTSLKGPTDQMMRQLGMEVSALQIARLYQDVADIFVLDQSDEVLRPEIEALGLQVVVTDTVMRDADKKQALAENILNTLSA